MKYQVPNKKINKPAARNLKIITKTKSRKNLYSPATPTILSKLDSQDVFKIDIPEDMMIIGSIDPSLQGKFGHIKSYENGEVTFELLSKKGLETVGIPDFCLIKI
eukprot:gene3288-5729_t